MKTQGMETTELKDIMIGFLEQNREGMASLLEWFLNNVMEMGAVASCHDKKRQSMVVEFIQIYCCQQNVQKSLLA